MKQNKIIVLIVAGGMLTFLYMVSLMHSMTSHIGDIAHDISLMSDNFAQTNQHMLVMTQQMQDLSKQVAEMNKVIQTGNQQVQRMNPMELMNPTGSQR
ncbi:MAG: hypothetical protein KZQ64_04800 [gamma proteobacterium symbiont of Bathyaustriella thionipta]|nr:hypothetical protein [gamma proteobacterium symbiont of Bathyaustriella thionipta]